MFIYLIELMFKKKDNCNNLVTRSNFIITFTLLLPSLLLPPLLLNFFIVAILIFFILYQLGYQLALAFFAEKVLYIRNYCKSSRMFKHKLTKIIYRSTSF